MKNRYKYIKRVYLWGALFLFIPLLLVVILRGGTKKEIYHVLVIQSLDDACAWKDELNRGVESCLKDQQVRAHIRTFYLNAEFLGAQTEVDTLTLMMDQYSAGKHPLDLIIVCDDQATYSLLTTHHPLTYRVPIVFCGVDYLNKGLLQNHSNVTGFITPPDYKKCYQLACQLFGRIDDMTILCEDTYLGEKGVADLRKQFSELPQVTAISESFADYSKIDTLRSRAENPLQIHIERIDKQDKTVLNRVLQYKPHRVSLLPKWSPFYIPLVRMNICPFLMMSNEGFGDGGGIGGYMTPSFDQTYAAAALGLQLMRGRSAMDFPVTASSQIPVFDIDQLNYWKIDLDRLPAGSRIPNMSFFERYFTLLICLGVGFLLLMSLLLCKLNKLYRREALYKKNAQIKLHKEQKELMTTLESINEGVVSISCDGYIFSMNTSAIRWLQFDQTVNTYLGCKYSSLFNLKEVNNPNYLNDIMQLVSQNSKSVKLSDMTYIETVDGRLFPVSGSLSVIVHQNKQIGFVITFRDVTEEYTHKESLALSLLAGEVFPWYYDQKQDSLRYDESFFQMYPLPGVDKNTISMSQFKTMIHPDDYPFWHHMIEAVKSGRTAKATVQLRLYFTDDHCEWWEYRIASMPRSAEGMYRLFGLCLNIEQLKKTEEDLIRFRDEAQQSDHLKGLFLADMSHEVRTPLNVILGFSTLLTEEESLSVEDRTTFINIINENCRLLLNLINEILDISRIESDIMFRQEPCDLNEIIKQIIDTQRQLSSLSVDLIADMPKQPILLNGDDFRLRQLIENLVNNAIKFTHVGQITVGYYVPEASCEVVIFVKDTGVGIAREEATKVFDRFYKSDHFVQGGGLGLAICQEIVKRMGGTIHVESELGQGSCFIIKLPNLCV
ncbi:MAG: PAS domain-containing sensor histidine kinase [Tannerellaceae bacterium]